MSYDDRDTKPRQVNINIGWLMVILLLLVVGIFWRSRGGKLGGEPELLDPHAQPRSVAARGDLAEDERSTITLFRQVSPAVVHVANLAVRRDVFRLNILEIPQGTGSGIIWDENGNIVTNYHVIESAQAYKVMLSDRSMWEARLVGAEPDKDIAVLKIDAPQEKLTPIMIGTSKDLIVGQKAFAIGNPFGLDQTLTTGIISGLGREILSMTKRPIQGVIQTDAAINPGNSGGALLDSAGRLIGVNTAIYSPSGASAGIGFAVPVDTVNRIVPQIIRHGKPEKVGLGITTVEDRIVEKLIQEKQLPQEGVLILEVKSGSPADKAGLQPTRSASKGQVEFGDLLIGIDGKPLRDNNDLFRALQQHSAGDTVKLTLIRDEKKLEVPVKLEVLP